MSSDRILLIESPCFLNLDLGRLCIRSGQNPKVYVGVKDVAVIVLHHHTISLSVSVLQTLSRAGTSVIVTDEKHMPCALMLPTQANRASPSRLRNQIEFLSNVNSQKIWQLIVRSRIKTQAENLRHFKLTGVMRLIRLIDEVEIGDRTHREGQAARHYWQHFWKDREVAFKRQKQGAEDYLNSMLNFGYAILRSLVARELVSAGLATELGVGHHSSENSFNLADDLMEPYRYIVERSVRSHDTNNEFSSKTRVALTRAIMDEIIKVDGKEYRLTPSIRETVASYVRILERKSSNLSLPFAF